MDKAKPIIFSGKMVRALLSGRKSQTRRVLKPSNVVLNGQRMTREWHQVDLNLALESAPKTELKCLKYIHQPGDLLWVREGWRIGSWNDPKHMIALDYRADGHPRQEWLKPTVPQFMRLWRQSIKDAEKVYGHQDVFKWEPGESPCRWRSPIFMPRWASRITLEVTGTRIERLQDISEKDARAEGAKETPFAKAGRKSNLLYTDGFENIWTSIYPTGPKSWDANPWIVVIEFKKANQSTEG